MRFGRTAENKRGEDGGIQEGSHHVALASVVSEEPLSPPCGSESNCTGMISLLQSKLRF